MVESYYLDEKTIVILRMRGMMEDECRLMYYYFSFFCYWIILRRRGYIKKNLKIKVVNMCSYKSLLELIR